GADGRGTEGAARTRLRAGARDPARHGTRRRVLHRRRPGAGATAVGRRRKRGRRRPPGEPEPREGRRRSAARGGTGVAAWRSLPRRAGGGGGGGLPFVLGRGPGGGAGGGAWGAPRGRQRGALFGRSRGSLAQTGAIV